MSMQVNLGHEPEDGAQRDAIHVAVIPMTAHTRLASGDFVSIRPSDGECQRCLKTNRSCVGVVDPFRRIPVEAGERFWLFLLPNTIRGMRHHWEHPLFRDESQEQVAVGSLDAVRSAVESTCERRGYRYNGWDETYKLFEIYTGDDEIHGETDEFWQEVAGVLGYPVPEQYRSGSFSCAC